MLRRLLLGSLSALVVGLTLQVAPGQGVGPPPGADQGQPRQQHMPGMDHPNQASGNAAEQQDTVMNAMSHEHMHMSAHMTFTGLRPTNPADQKRAAELVQILRASIGRYRDYHLALQEGYKIFLPQMPQEIYHFNDYESGLGAMFEFDPSHPTSLLYKKTADGYELVGAMYTAPRDASEEQLNQRVPLSVARWHKHVNICLPPRGRAARSQVKAQAKAVDFSQFGPRGSIDTEQSCEDAGGRWFPVIFGWMVHVYPFEKDPAKIWAH